MRLLMTVSSKKLAIISLSSKRPAVKSLTDHRKSAILGQIGEHRIT